MYLRQLQRKAGTDYKGLNKFNNHIKNTKEHSDFLMKLNLR